MLPQTTQKIEYRPVSDIDFSSAKSKKKKFDLALNSDRLEAQRRVRVKPCQEPTGEEFSSFLRDRNNTGTQCAILSVAEPYGIKFVPLPVKSCLPKPLTELREE